MFALALIAAHVGRLVFYRDPFFLLFFRQLATELAEWNSTKTSHIQSGVFPLPTNRGSQNHYFSTILQLNGKFNGLYLRNETRYA